MLTPLTATATNAAHGRTDQAEAWHMHAAGQPLTRSPSSSWIEGNASQDFPEDSYQSSGTSHKVTSMKGHRGDFRQALITTEKLQQGITMLPLAQSLPVLSLGLNGHNRSS